MMSIIEHFNAFWGETKHLSGEKKKIIKVEHFSGETKA